MRRAGASGRIALIVVGGGSTVLASMATAIAPAVAAATAHCPPPGTAAEGAWVGSWTARAGGPTGAAGLVVSSTQPDEALGQFTFVVGATSHTARYPGVLCEDAWRFTLPAQGEIVLRPQGDRLVGSFHGDGAVLPAASGTIELTRSR